MATTTISPPELMERLSNIMTAPFTVCEVERAIERANLKLKEIIAREGDAGGARREPWYFEEILKDTLRESRAAIYAKEVTKHYVG